MKHYAPWEKAFERISTPFENFIHAQTTSGLVLIFVTILALLFANTPLVEFYTHLIHTNITFNVGDWKISHSIQHWINDGLMAIFFFMVGLEIKREVLIGELSTLKVATLPILSAIGGMVLPALIYLSINEGTPSANGWGIPMATDIAFAISALVLLGNRVSPALVTFLVALAIVDDLGAVLVIALFYTNEINILALFLSGLSFITMIALNRFGIRAILPYFIVGLSLWFFMLESGIHATIAGVLAAMTIPSKAKLAPLTFTHSIKNLLDEYDNYPIATDNTIHDKQKAILRNIQDKIDAVGSPATKLERELHLPVSLLVIPIFALCNAGITIDLSSLDSTLNSPTALGVIFGLVFGKVLGIAGVAWLAIKLKIATLPTNSTMKQIFGVAFLGGIGFTMSIFVADLAFVGNETLIYQAKISILLASLTSGLIGYFWLRSTPSRA